ncbi:gp53-like domain-containing protein [Piscirickettsia litoralis]|uniref:Putative tail fiber protein gp53-like C-terminal domain-containing protein n=1 Tax=Piscirickettsia litoralis TaxID=1891921 RepID=A0ABX2ZWN5_9GAMM|nr:hypothetical protein [Piscirickettsia litoralis]ODN41041.1 hypothetical protein BGC07_18600 [Piscirickettsia litoralis]
MQDFKVREITANSSPADDYAKLVNSILSNQSNFSGDNEPTNPVGGMFWVDTKNKKLWQRNSANTGWIDKGLTDSAMASMDDLKAYSASPNLLVNSLFDDWNGSPLPRHFWNYYHGNGRNTQLTKIAVNAGDSIVESMASLIATDYVHRVTENAYALKVSLDAGSSEWSLNQQVLVPRDCKISQGVYLYIETTGDADVRIHDDPWPIGHSPVPKSDFNKPIKWFQFKETNVAGGDLGFLISIRESTAPITVYIMAPWLTYGYCDHWVDSSIGSRTLKALERGAPFVCSNPNPYFSASNGDEYLHTHNPHSHTITREFVEPEHNQITKDLSYYLGGFDGDGNRNEMTALTHMSPRFMKVTVTKNPSASNINFTLTGGGAPYTFAQGTTTSFIGLFGVEEGHVILRDGSRVNAGTIRTNIKSQMYRGASVQGYGHSYHWDYFSINTDEGTEKIVFYLSAYMVCAGYARYWNEIAVPSLVNTCDKVGDTGYMVNRSTGMTEQWGTVQVAATTEDTFWLNFPKAFDYECTNIILTPFEATQDNFNDMHPVVVGAPEKGRCLVRFNWTTAGTKQAAGFSYIARGR